MLLLTSDRRTIFLVHGHLLVLGRADLPQQESRVCVSRKQCWVELQPDGTVNVTSCGSVNATVIFAEYNGQAIRKELTEGQSCAIRPGDRLALHPTVDAARFELRSEPDDVEQPVNMPATRQLDEPAAKRQKMSGDAATSDATAASPLMLVMVGPPGSGKSTWATQLQDKSAVPWQRICQDSINDGARGSRQDCLKAADGALVAGRNVIIDRTNIDVSQRADFLALARQLNVKAYAVVLHLEAKLCVVRAVKRTDHEGNLQGGAAAAAVNRMHGQMIRNGLPTAAEGFSGIMICKTPREVGNALKAWSRYTTDAAEVLRRFEADRGAGTLEAAWGKLSPKGKSWTSNVGTATVPSAAADPQGSAAAKASPVAAAAAAAVQRAKQGTAKTEPPSQVTASQDVESAQGPAHQHQPHVDSLLQSTPSASAADQHAASPSADDLRLQAVSGAITASACSEKAKMQNSLHQGSANDLEQAGSSLLTGTGKPGKPDGSTAAAAVPNAFAAMLSASKTATKQPARTHVRKRPWLNQPWAQDLHRTAMDPDKHPQPRLMVGEHCVCFPDKYPKACHHALVVARLPGLEAVDCLRQDHIPILHAMQEMAQQFIKQEQQADPACAPFRLGFHAVPSMRQLHMHCISQDLASPMLKNKKHYNSFTKPGFFLPLPEVISALEIDGAVTVDDAAAEALLKADMHCHNCGQLLRNIPALKAHLPNCRHSYPLAAQ